MIELKKTLSAMIALVVTTAVLTGCATAPAPASSPARPVAAAPPASSGEPSLYKRLGGYDAIAAVVDDFLPRLLNDKQVGRYFAGMSKLSKDTLREHIIELLCDLAKGPCTYVGRDVHSAHEGLGITESDWKVTVGHLVETLDKFNVPQHEREQLLAAITFLHDDIVEKR